MIAKVEDKEEKKQKSAHSKSISDFSVKAAGAGTFVADAALMARGLHYKENETAFLLAGAFGLTAGTVGGLWGNPGTEKQLKQLHRKLGDYLRKEGVEIPQNPTTADLTKKDGLFSKISDFLSNYPTQVMNVLYGMIGGAFMYQGKKVKENELVISGILLITGALCGLFIEEKKPDPKHPPEGALEKTWSWIQEKPLRLTGTLLNANQLLLAKNTWNEWKTNPASKKYIYKAIAVAGFTFGNIMLMLSSTSHGGSDKKADPKIINGLASTSARVIAAQPQEVQDALLEHVAGYLSTQPNINMKAADISAVLHKKLDEVKQAPAAANWVARTAQTQVQSPQPSI